MDATYELIQPYWDKATDRTGPKLETIRVTLIIDLSPWKWGTTHCPLMCCMHATYEVIRSNKKKATERRQQKLQMTHVTLTFDLLIRKVCATHCELMGCVCISYEVNRWNRDGATEQTLLKLRTTRVTLTPVWLFILKMVHDTSSPHVFYVCHICPERTRQKLLITSVTSILNNRCYLDLLSFDLEITCLHVMDYICTMSNRYGATEWTQQKNLLPFVLKACASQAFYHITVWCKFHEGSVIGTW